MAIAEMTKLNLIGMSSEREQMLDALSATGLVHLKTQKVEEDSDEANTTPIPTVAYDGTALYKALEILDNLSRNDKEPIKVQFEQMDFADFLNIRSTLSSTRGKCDRILTLKADIDTLSQQVERLSSRKEAMLPYICCPADISLIKCTRRAYMSLGKLPIEHIQEVVSNLSLRDTVQVEVYPASESSSEQAVLITGDIRLKEEIEDILSQVGYVGVAEVPHSTARELITDIDTQCADIKARINDDTIAIKQYFSIAQEIAVAIDYVQYFNQKNEINVSLPTTSTTYTLEAYVPQDKVETVTHAIESVSRAVYYEYAPISEEDNPPTLIKSSKPIKQFSFITDMYSVPNYREVDPNPIMSVFFLVFFGFIMADIGYGILLALGGYLLGRRIKRDTGTRRLMYVLSMGGLFTIIFGILFGSFFGLTHEHLALIPTAIMPDPTTDYMKLFVISLGLGIAQMFVAFFMKGANLIHKGNVVDGLVDGMLWCVFFVGLAMVGLGLAEDLAGITAPQGISTLGLYICAGVVGAEVILSIRIKGSAKFVKMFTSVYNLIGYLSDLLSYARLFGLMLSGNIIAGIVVQYATPMLSTTMMPLGVLIILIGHGFNLAMGALGAYIHDSRLQYIEFYSRFYEGEGEAFNPMGNDLTYVYFNR